MNKQKQSQLSKQDQLLDQNFSNEIMLNSISALENLAIYHGFKGNRIFDYYSGYANTQNEKELVKAVQIQLEIFRNSSSSYSSIYSNYDFPKNLSKEQIINYIKEWEKFIPDKNKIYYNEIIKYLDGHSDHSEISEIIDKQKKDWGPITREDLARIGRSAPFINTQMFNQMDEIKETYNKNLNYEILANLNKGKEDNKEMAKFNQYDREFCALNQKFLNVEKTIEEFFKNIIYKNLPLQDSDARKLQILVDEFKKLIVALPFEEDKYGKKINLYKSFIKNIPIKFKEKNVSKFLCDICNIIISYYDKNCHSYM